MGPDPAPAIQEWTVTGHGGNSPGQGPFITLRLVIRQGVIEEATYETYQCPGSHACGGSLCNMLRGSSLEQAGAIRHDHLVERVGPLPPHRRHCYGLALLALTDALGRLTPNEGKE
jgi:NifU-like protein involved in Fe-S cluster formation